MLRAERLSALLETLASQRSIDVGAMAAEFGVSSPRSDVISTHFHEQGLLVRTHGGAVSSDMTSSSPSISDFPAETGEAPYRPGGGQSRTNNAVVGLTGGTTTTNWLGFCPIETGSRSSPMP